MTKLKTALLAFFLICFIGGYAQNSVNSIDFAPEKVTQPKTGVAYTPKGIVKNSPSAVSRYREDLKALFASAVKVINESVESIESVSPIQFKFSMLLNVNVESLTNLALFKSVEKWMGTRYRLGGTSNSGIDCSALTEKLLENAYGLALPRTAKEQYKATAHVDKSSLTQGDLVFFNTHGGVSHVGLYLDNHYFVHASSSNGVIISSLDDSYYAKRFICGGRVECN